MQQRVHGLRVVTRKPSEDAAAGTIETTVEPATAERGSRTRSIFSTSDNDGVPTADKHHEAFEMQQHAEREVGLSRLRAQRLVRSLSEAECPVCLGPFAELPFPSPRVPRGAFECDHPLCHECHRRLLSTSMADNVDAYRCPLCRAPGLETDANGVAAARAEAARRRELTAPLEVRRAVETAAAQVIRRGSSTLRGASSALAGVAAPPC